MHGAGLIAGRFEVIGQRGTETVHQARDLQSGRIVTVKTMALAERDRSAVTFEREVRIMSRLSSPHLQAVLAGGVDGDVSYLAMEQVDGISLSDLLATSGGRLPLERVAAIGRQLAAGLSVAHGAGVVHRDLRPENVTISPYGVVKLLHLGVGRTQDIAARYQAPEQDGSREATPATDLYALGCLLHEMLTGRPPRDGQPRLSDEVPSDLSLLISRLLEREPAKRPADAYEVSLLLTLVILAQGAIAMSQWPELQGSRGEVRDPRERIDLHPTARSRVFHQAG